MYMSNMTSSSSNSLSRVVIVVRLRSEKLLEETRFDGNANRSHRALTNLFEQLAQIRR